ncbi:thioesterase family protein [Rhodococcus sp. IEGM 1379]|uniref:thioesterase family protein n=1 Tax=Rhodococcus sp. IEGM 1379 TaxID=3047086 RepID=UPI0024B6F4B6|nr:thioesterase family protein [Rhodococcus sp. IEGM 1379]MDI9918435.1 thioesterase family protein [Rhodococcus sp. IEGM 1379]
MSTSPFRDLNRLTLLGDGRFVATIDPIWTIGPKVHGGSMMAVCAAAARQALRDAAGESEGVLAMQPLAVSANYLAAPDPGDVDLVVTIQKQGRQVALVDVELSQAGRVAVRAAVTLGFPDGNDPTFVTASSIDDMPEEPSEHAVAVVGDHPMAQIVHVGQGCDMRIDTTSAHFLTGSQGEPEVRMWVRPRPEDEADVDTAVLFAIMTGDISAPVTMNRGLFGWAPTVQLTTYLRRLPAPGWLRVRASSDVLGSTWFEEDHDVLDSTGAVVVQSRQLAMMPR